MKKILITAYAINPYKGSEDGTGWHFVLEASRQNEVIAITRKNNREHIERYCQEQNINTTNLNFEYFDLPYWMRWWKKGPMLSMIYFYMWQLGIALWIKSRGFQFDIAHALNFHSDWTPSLLWLLGKPFIWGPIGHHPPMPKSYLLKSYGRKAFLKDRILWTLKNLFWTFDPFLKITKYKADHIFCINSSVPKKLNLKTGYSIMPAVAIDQRTQQQKSTEAFKIITIGRMVPLKGFRTALEAFIDFYNQLSDEQKKLAKMDIIGSGPDIDWLKEKITEHNVESAVTIIPWMERNDVLQEYKKASVFFFPSHEGAGMVVPEAMSYGLPVLCYDNEGPGELCPATTQLKVKYGPNSIKKFSRKLNQLFEDKQLLENESRLASHHVQNHMWIKRNAQLELVYNKILSHYETNHSYSFAK